MLRKRVRGIAILAAAVMVMLTGCGLTAEDAKAYAKGVLDANYKGEFKTYIKQTDSTKKEAEELYENSIDKSMESAGFKEAGISDELLSNYRQMFLDLGKVTKYELADAKEEEKDAYTIDVTIEPFIGFNGVQEEVTQKITEEISAMSEVPGKEQINELFFQRMYEVMDAKIKNPVYGEKQTVTIHVQPNSKGAYYIPDEDMAAVDEVMISLNEL